MATGVLFLLLLLTAVSLAPGAVLRDAFAGAQNVVCGRRPVEPSLERIVNGDTPVYGSYPWQVAIYVLSWGQWTFYCGGIIIHHDWILTAAHCVIDLNPSMVKVHVGDHDRMKQDRSEQVFKAQRLFVHENYNNPLHNNDIALVKLRPDNGQGIQFDDNVQPACLPAPDTAYTAGKKCLISGWGFTKPGTGEASVVLQAAEVPLMSHSQCKKALGPYGEILTSKQVCAGPVNPYGGVCNGDSGGPLVSREEAGYTVLGITSWGDIYSCGMNRDPGVFVKVNQFLPWIKEKMKA